MIEKNEIAALEVESLELNFLTCLETSECVKPFSFSPLIVHVSETKRKALAF